MIFYLDETLSFERRDAFVWIFMVEEIIAINVDVKNFAEILKNLQIIKSYLSPYIYIYIDVYYELFEFPRDIKVLRILVYYICIITCWSNI